MKNNFYLKALIVCPFFFWIFILQSALLPETPADSADITEPKEIVYTTKEIGGIEFVYIKSGTFIMGSQEILEKHDELPAHEVEIDSFLISRHEITRARYKEITGKDQSTVSKKLKDADPEKMAVNSVTWYEAMEFCKKFSVRYKVTARLPYEAEWEYAARAGTQTKYYWGEEPDGRYCWFRENSNLHDHAVKEKLPNQWGLYDMSGNLWEWCMDWYDANYYKTSPKNNPQGPEEGTYKILRGGSWESQKYSLRCANRQRTKPDDYGDDAGFRIVIDFRK